MHFQSKEIIKTGKRKKKKKKNHFELPLIQSEKKDKLKIITLIDGFLLLYRTYFVVCFTSCKFYNDAAKNVRKKRALSAEQKKKNYFLLL